MDNKTDNLEFDSRVIHAAKKICPTTGAMWPPIYQATSYLFDSVIDGAKKCEHIDNGYCYTRLGNPTLSAFEEKVAALEEGAESAVSFASGVAAISSFLLYFLKQGDHVIADETSYSATHYIFEDILKKFGVETSFIDTSDIDVLNKNIKANTTLIYFETPANPTIKIVDIEAVASIAKKHGIFTAVDSTIGTPQLQHPLKLGVDIVIHSATKYLCGHGDALAGVIVGSKKIIDEIRDSTLKNIGGILSPMNAYLLLRGLKTLDLRMKKHCDNAMKVASYLESHPKVERVFYPGLESHPQHELAKKQMSDFGGMIAFEVVEGMRGGVTLMENIKLCSLAVSLGHCETLVEHPASMTHYYVPKVEREEAGITDGLVRISVGLENPEDLIYDLNQALDKI